MVLSQVGRRQLRSRRDMGGSCVQHVGAVPGLPIASNRCSMGNKPQSRRSFTGYWESFAFRTVVISLIVGIAIGLIGGTPSAWRTC